MKKTNWDDVVFGAIVPLIALIISVGVQTNEIWTIGDIVAIICMTIAGTAIILTGSYYMERLLNWIKVKISKTKKTKKAEKA